MSPEDRDRGLHVRDRAERAQLLRRHVASGSEPPDQDRQGHEREPEEDPERDVAARVLDLLRERARVLHADEGEHRDPEECREEAPGEVGCPGKRCRSGRTIPVPARPMKPKTRSERTMNAVRATSTAPYGPDPGDVQERHQDDEDDDPERRARPVRPEEALDDRRRRVGLGGGREELNGDVADEHRQSREEGPEARANVLVHRSGLRDHRGQLGKAHALQVHGKEAHGEGRDEDIAREEARGHGRQHGRCDDQPEGRADRGRKPDCAPLETDFAHLSASCHEALLLAGRHARIDDAAIMSPQARFV